MESLESALFGRIVHLQGFAYARNPSSIPRVPEYACSELSSAEEDVHAS